MRRATLLLVLLAAAAPVAASGEARHPALALVSRAPLTVRGAEFRPREAVHVSFSAGGQTKVVFVRATRTGTFVASADVPVSRCSALRIVAVGMLGSTAVAHLPQPACIPARAPGANP